MPFYWLSCDVLALLLKGTVSDDFDISIRHGCRYHVISVKTLCYLANHVRKRPIQFLFIDRSIIERGSVERPLIPRLLLSLVCLLCPFTSANAQQATETSTELSEQVVADGAEPNLKQSNPAVAAKIKQLLYIKSALDSKIVERRELGNQIAAANEQDRADLSREANEITADVTQLRKTLEAIATGGVNRKLFETAATDEKKDWREDVSLIAQPVIDSLKEITEKPRRVKELNKLIELKNAEINVSKEALNNLATITKSDDAQQLHGSLLNLTHKWQKRLNDAQAAIALADIQLKGLAGDQSLSMTIYSALIKFAKGRGLTIVMAIAVAWTVWFSIHLLLKFYQHTLLDKRRKDSRTRYRVAKYSVQAMTFSLVLIGVFIVFYERHDVLLLGLLILLIVGFVLNAKQLLPKYIKEARLLLNLGAVREGERVIYNDLPFRVESINLYTIFNNPELDGAFRIPLSELTKISSRPVTNDSWFPTSVGDIVFLQNANLLEVLNQNPDTVELKKRGGELLSIPTAHFYAMSMTNLTRLGTFGVTSSFGVDYNHQHISTTEIPTQLKIAVDAAISASDLADALQEVRVELAEAANSSINYWIFVTMHSRVAFSYYRVERIIQSACIETCGHRGWTIPFPHISLVNKPDAVANTANTSQGKPYSATG